MTVSKRQIHKIDASGKILGRLAVDVANLLRGKGRTDFQPHIDAGDEVTVYNIENIKISGKKMSQKKYRRHSGYYGGLTEVSLEELMSKDPGEALRRAVKGMLPHNRLAGPMIKRLTIIEGDIK